jgi:pimeloyl-ACP methyl ester carboxylesterase
MLGGSSPGAPNGQANGNYRHGDFTSKAVGRSNDHRTPATRPFVLPFYAVPTEGDQRRLFPKELMLRPLQLRAAAEDAALMTPTAMELEQHYREIRTPVTIITGVDDQISDVGRQSERLHQELASSEFIALPGLGHMIHDLAPDAVATAIVRASHVGGR